MLASTRRCLLLGAFLMAGCQSEGLDPSMGGGGAGPVNTGIYHLSIETERTTAMRPQGEW